MGKKDWFVTLQFGIVGCTGYEVFKNMTQDEAQAGAYEECIQWASSYGYEQDQDVFGDLDTVGADFDEETGEYGQEGFIDPEVTEYHPEKHDGYLY